MITNRLLQITQGAFEWNGIQYFFEGRGFENRPSPFKFGQKGPHPGFLQYPKDLKIEGYPTLFFEAEAVPIEKIFWFNPKYSDIIKHKSVTIRMTPDLKVFMQGSTLVLEHQIVLRKKSDRSWRGFKTVKEEFHFVRKISDIERDIFKRKRMFYFEEANHPDSISWVPACAPKKISA